MDTIRIKLREKWGKYLVGDVADFGERKARVLIKDGVAEETKDALLTQKHGAQVDKLKIRFIKAWASKWKPGDVADFGDRKARRLIKDGVAEVAGAKKEAMKPVEVETAMLEPATEKAVITPVKKAKTNKWQSSK